jgi:hypothetical protein
VETLRTLSAGNPSPRSKGAINHGNVDGVRKHTTVSENTCQKTRTSKSEKKNVENGKHECPSQMAER